MTYLQFKQSLDALGIKDDQPVTFAVHGENNPFQWFATTDDYNIDASRMSDRIWRVSLIPESATKPPTSPQPTQQHSAIPAQSEAATANPNATAAMVWQPIDTAPKDGTKFLCTNKEHYSVNNQPPGCFFGKWDFLNGSWRGSANMEFEPTHWMPLPPAPAIVQQ